MSKAIRTNYEGRYMSKTKSPLNEEPITVNAVRFTPVDLLTSAYGSCILGTIDFEARKKEFETTEARSEITYEMSEDKNKIEAMSIKIFLGNEYTDQQKEVIENAAKYQCHVGNSLDPAIKREYEFTYNTK